MKGAEPLQVTPLFFQRDGAAYVLVDGYGIEDSLFESFFHPDMEKLTKKAGAGNRGSTAE